MPSVIALGRVELQDAIKIGPGEIRLQSDDPYIASLNMGNSLARAALVIVIIQAIMKIYSMRNVNRKFQFVSIDRIIVLLSKYKKIVLVTANKIHLQHANLTLPVSHLRT